MAKGTVGLPARLIRDVRALAEEAIHFAKTAVAAR
jgi:hypothetical protein